MATESQRKDFNQSGSFELLTQNFCFSLCLCGKRLFFLVNLVRIEERVRVFHPLVVFPANVETTAISCMAGCRSVLLDLDDHGVGITISQYLDDVLSVARLFSFHPVLLAGAAVEPGLAIAQSVVESFFVHEGDHENFTTFMVLDNRG